MLDATHKTIADLPTPCLILDKSKMDANIARVADRMRTLGGTLRPHLKTGKSIQVARAIMDGGQVQGVTVSTLHEAEYFFENGISDILYAVGIAPNKVAQAAHLMARGCDLKIVLDNPDMAALVSDYGQTHACMFKVMIEIDTDGHRSGADPKGDSLLQIAKALVKGGGAELIGVMTHAGESYLCHTPEDLLKISRQERELSVLAAQRLRAAGHASPVVSVGSTPTALSIDDLTGVTEVRAGVYVFFDLVMAGIGVCDSDDIAASVLASVIGYQKDRGWAITDAGWMAMSRDRGTADQDVDFGYGKVVDVQGASMGALALVRANQEHGVIGALSGDVPFEKLPLGSLVRVLPNHACATAAQYDKYYVGDGDRVIDTLSRINGW